MILKWAEIKDLFYWVQTADHSFSEPTTLSLNSLFCPTDSPELKEQEDNGRATQFGGWKQSIFSILLDE